MMAKGTYASINLATNDLDGTFERLQAGDAEVVQEPTDQPYGVRDCAFRDPGGQPDPHPGTALTRPERDAWRSAPERFRRGRAAAPASSFVLRTRRVRRPKAP